MLKVKSFLSEVKNNWNEDKTAKLAKVLSFFSGLAFSVLGIIIVAVIKYMFCSKEEKCKYCIRLSIIGAIARFVIFTKIIALNMFGFGFPFNDNFYKQKSNDVAVVRPVYVDDFFEREVINMNNMFNRFNAIQQEIFAEDFFNDKKKNVESTKKVSIDKNGYKKTVIEEKGPNNYYKKVVVKEKYSSDNKDINKENDVKKNENKKNKKSDKKKKN